MENNEDNSEEYNIENRVLGPIRSFFLFHIFDSPMFWLGLFFILFFNVASWGEGIYNLLGAAPALADSFENFYFMAYENGIGWWGLLFIAVSVISSWIRYKVTRFAVEGGVLVITRGYITPNPFELFVRRDNTVALNLIYDVDVNRNMFQYIFGGGDIRIRTASSEVFTLEFMEEPHEVRKYLLEHSGIKNKPVIGVY